MRTVVTYLTVQGFTAWNLWLSLTDARTDGTYIYLAFAALVFAHSAFAASGAGIRQLCGVYLATTFVNTLLDFYWTGYGHLFEGVWVTASIGLAYFVPGLAGVLLRKLIYRRGKDCP